MYHLTQRVPWHDNKWDGSVCSDPLQNSFCVALKRIRGERDDEKECALAGQFWGELKKDQLPPCKAEAGAFMNSAPWVRTFKHPYKDIKKAAETHGHLEETSVTVPPCSTFSVPFAWMLRENLKEIGQTSPKGLPLDVDPPFRTAWVFGRECQEALLELMFGKLTPEKSLVFFYCKEGHPLGEGIPRLVIGVGRLLDLAKLKRYETKRGNGYPLWDRLITHSVTPKGHDGFLLPYHEYLIPTGDEEEDNRRRGLLGEIAVTPDTTQMRAFSYASELASPDVALSTLVRCLNAVRKVREHGIVDGPWHKREEWLNQQMAAVWTDRGAFPGTGAALEALGVRLGTSLYWDLCATGAVKPEGNPWDVIDKILRGKQEPPQVAYKGDIKAIKETWAGLPAGRRELLILLSRFDITPRQAKRWYDEGRRVRSTRYPVSDLGLVENPYRIVEADLGDEKEPPISFGSIDRGLLPADTIRVNQPVPEPSKVESHSDARRFRAVLAQVLLNAAREGDTLLSAEEATERARKHDGAESVEITLDWLKASSGKLKDLIDVRDVEKKGDNPGLITVLQLQDIKGREESLRKKLIARAGKQVEFPRQDWVKLLKEAITAAGSNVDEKNPRHRDALKDQADALGRLTARRLSVLVGRAGTGKTATLGALLRCQEVKKDGVLLLAPTGKARVRLGKAAGATAMTVAQFLYSLGRYDGARQRPLFEGKETYRKERTVVVDECSMLTLDDLFAIVSALDLAHVQRVILVGDPNQLPPIGVGRPFADLVGHLERLGGEKAEEARGLAEALAKLTVEVRTAMGAPSDTLRLATWFTREPQSVDADRILSDLELKKTFNDLEICFWKTPDELRTRLLEQFRKHLGLKSDHDVEAFNRAIGLNEKGWVPYENPNGAENFQILSPVRMHPHGIYDINRWVQQQFRKEDLAKARKYFGVILGDEEISVRDKVIQVQNQTRNVYDVVAKKPTEEYVANGEVGVATNSNNGFLNVMFAGRPNRSFGYNWRDFPRGGSGPLELAYALTIHKAQGSEFGKVFVILPRNCPLISRELLYTALTRAKEHLILLVEGDDVSALYDLSRPERSETARRNSNLFEADISVRERADVAPYAEHLIHRTAKGHMVRSKSELVIANMLHSMAIPYEYERPLEGTKEPGKMRPDFSFIDAAGDVIVWEHLGMLDNEEYRSAWERKKKWYEKNGFVQEDNLFTSSEGPIDGLNSDTIRITAGKVKELL
jgi:ATP-dependent exoDNAse (exonuclease V) alpha subunit